jgi:U3 small nucleolar RNA-associated protein 3
MSPGLLYSPCVDDFLSLSPGFLSSSPGKFSNVFYPNLNVATSRKLTYDTVAVLEGLVAMMVPEKEIEATAALAEAVVAPKAMILPEEKISAPKEDIALSEEEIAEMAAPAETVAASEEETTTMDVPAAEVVVLEEKIAAPEENIAVPEEEMDLGGDDSKREVGNKIMANRGLPPHRNKEHKNPRKRLRGKFEKAVVRRKGQVRPMREDGGGYGGEASGIKTTVTKSRRFGV